MVLAFILADSTWARMVAAKHEFSKIEMSRKRTQKKWVSLAEFSWARIFTGFARRTCEKEWSLHGGQGHFFAMANLDRKFPGASGGRRGGHTVEKFQNQLNACLPVFSSRCAHGITLFLAA